MEKFNTNWIWDPGWKFSHNEEPQFVCFRKELYLDGKPDSCNIKITADSRYKLYVNGEFMQEGPAKGDEKIWYYDEAKIMSRLNQGVNVLAVIVLRYPENKEKRNLSLHRSMMPGVYIEGEIIAGGKRLDVSGSSGWKCRQDDNRHIVSKEIPPAPLHILEEAGCDKKMHGWMNAGYDDSAWNPAKLYGSQELSLGESPCNMIHRPVPYQRHKKGRFKTIMTVREYTGSDLSDEQITRDWEQMISGGRSVTIPANTKLSIELDAGELMTGYLRLAFSQGKDAAVTLKCAESYGYYEDLANPEAEIPKKGDRMDFKKGTLFGYEDVYHCAGCGSRENAESYEPFWFRTFRFLGVTVETGCEPLVIESLDFTETGYPLDVRTKVETSDKTFQEIWDISERTLRRCMHETYMDCPFFEQLQYAMDSRAQILFTYMTAADDRLARQCMDDFRRSQRYDGTLNCCAPSCWSHVIPGFSIYYILMVHDHMMFFGDRQLIGLHLPAIEGVLDYFERNLTEQGLVGVNGGPVFRQKYWSFIDWTVQWNEYAGVPAAIQYGPVTMESLLYIYGLLHAAEICHYMGRTCMEEEYRKRADKVRRSVQEYCMGSNGLIMDGPGVEEYSVHCQVFAVLTDTLPIEQGRAALKKTIGRPEYAQCSVAMNFYLFRALEKAGAYEMTEELWGMWREMLDQHLTTCVENTTDARSDCHAWGALALYELPAVILGVRPAAPGFEKVRIQPVSGHFTSAKGEVITPKGMITVEWTKEEKLKVRYTVPEGLEVVEENSESY